MKKVKNTPSKFMYKMTKLPLIGRFFRILFVFNQLPEIHREFIELKNNVIGASFKSQSLQLPIISEKISIIDNKQITFESFLRQELPIILASINEINSKKASIENIINSLPVSLRRNMRDLILIKQKLKEIDLYIEKNKSKK